MFSQNPYVQQSDGLCNKNIAKKCVEMAKTCRVYGVNNFFISSIICRRNVCKRKALARLFLSQANVSRKRIYMQCQWKYWSRGLMSG